MEAAEATGFGFASETSSRFEGARRQAASRSSLGGIVAARRRFICLYSLGFPLVPGAESNRGGGTEDVSIADDPFDEHFPGDGCGRSGVEGLEQRRGSR